LNKQQLIAALAERQQLTKTKAGAIIDALFAADGLVAGELRRSGKVQITGFGNFELRRRKGRAMRNPRTGKTTTLPPTLAPAFRAGKALKDAMQRRRG
jgi:DNA-binding protein HU-beta